MDSTDSQKKIITFGKNNNYKDSEIRKWLRGRCTGEAGLQMGAGALMPVNVGVRTAFLGQTSPGTEGEAAETELVKYTLLPQMMSDRMFLLSVEEALEYREELWDTVSEETEGEAAETELVKYTLLPQMMSDRMFLLSVEEALEYREELWDTVSEESSYSRGYWLRTPVYQEGENGGFTYGTEAYAVDLRDGTIGPAEVSDGSFGLRPAYCLPQPPSGVLSAAVIAGAPGSGRYWEQRGWIFIVTGGKRMQFEKREMKMRLTGKAGRAAVFCLCAGLVLGDPMKGFAWEQTEHVRRATGSNALGRPLLMTESKDLWENWVGNRGDGFLL